MSASPRFLARMYLDSSVGVHLSNTRIRLLEQIDLRGSINQAAKGVPLSYKAAWDTIDIMNNLSPNPLVVRVTGGRQGGGTQLTDYGRKLVALYRALEIEYQSALDQLSQHFYDVASNDTRAFQHLLQPTRMNTSARNQFSGKICGLHQDLMSYQVEVRLDQQHTLAADITRASAENLDLQIGQEVFAMVKSTSMVLTTENNLRLSVDNQFWGEISQIERGPVNSEVTLNLPDSSRTLTAVITNQSCRSLGLRPGTQAAALFKASSVILATCN